MSGIYILNTLYAQAPRDSTLTSVQNNCALLAPSNSLPQTIINYSVTEQHGRCIALAQVNSSAQPLEILPQYNSSVAPLISTTNEEPTVDQYKPSAADVNLKSKPLKIEPNMPVQNDQYVACAHINSIPNPATNQLVLVQLCNDHSADGTKYSIAQLNNIISRHNSSNKATPVNFTTQQNLQHILIVPQFNTSNNFAAVNSTIQPIQGHLILKQDVCATPVNTTTQFISTQSDSSNSITSTTISNSPLPDPNTQSNKKGVFILPNSNPIPLKPHQNTESNKKHKLWSLNHHFLPLNSTTQPKHSEPIQTPLACEVCHKMFRSKKDLQKHLHLQSGEKHFGCHICGKALSHSSNLRKHLLQHAGVRRYHCNVCNKAFNQNAHFKQHLKIHTGERPFECEFCKRSFIEKSNLKAHLVIHTGEKPFACDICSKKFPRRESMKTHMALHSRNSRRKK